MSNSKFRTVVITVSGNRTVLRIFYYRGRAFPYPLRRAVTTLFINLDFPDRTEFPEHAAPWDGSN